MEGGGLFCPVEECEDNRGGYCGIRQEGPLGWAAAAFYMPGASNMMAPFGPAPFFGPAVGMLGNSTMAEGQPPMTDSWGMWRNCPRRKAKSLRE